MSSPAASLLLSVDIGNTDTVVGVFEGSQLTTQWRIPSEPSDSAAKLAPVLASCFHQAGISPAQVAAVGISSVVPPLTAVWTALAADPLHVMPFIVHGTLPHLGMKICYDDPASLGTDRLCTAVAAHARYGGPVIVVDFGTATTYTVVAANGDLLGGAITLGVGSQVSALHRRTAQLPPVTLTFPASPIATGTTAAIQAGVLFGAADAVEGMIARICRELGAPARAVATGGLSTVVAPHCPSISATVPTLVLEGIRLLWLRHQPATS